MTTAAHRTFFLPGPAGRLEALLWTPARDGGVIAAVVCHPHPLFGGTLHNKVVYQVAKTFNQLQAPVLRFNFRGAGLSGGKHDEGRGEQDDVRAAIEFLAKEYSGRPLLLAGFSFGAFVGLRVGCSDTRVAAVAGLGLPVNRSDVSYLQQCAKPKLVIQGSEDQFGSRAAVEALAADMPEPKRVVFIEGAEHFFAGKLDQVGAALRTWLTELYPDLESL